MNKTNPSDPAFPNIIEMRDHEGCTPWPHIVGGLTKREIFAIKALQGMLAKSFFDVSNEALVRDSVIFADALIRKLNEGGDKKEYE